MPKINSLNFIQSFWKIVACQISEFAENEPTPALFLGNNEWPPLCYEERRNYPNGVADFSKAFDTVCFKTTIDKFYKLGFSKIFLKWLLNYTCPTDYSLYRLTTRRRFLLQLKLGFYEALFLDRWFLLSVYLTYMKLLHSQQSAPHMPTIPPFVLVV